MRSRIGKKVSWVAAALFTAIWPASFTTAESNAPVGFLDGTDRLIVKLRDPAESRVAALSATRLASLGVSAGVRFTHLRRMSGDAQVLRLDGRLPIADVEAIARRLSADPEVEYAEADRPARPHLVPNDTLYGSQWHYHAFTTEVGGANLPSAWDITTGSAGMVVAVIDTGILPHADLTGRTVSGYDFISEDAPGDFTTANDGDGRDSDPTDPGDWCDGISDSSWHGTHVAGTIGAASNNGAGVTGVNWASRIQPVRVLGKCGGYLSDIVDAMRWAAGVPGASIGVGIPDNATPAKVLNLSLGGQGSCSTAAQNAITGITAAPYSAVVVVSAGNESQDAANAWPANCNGVITVAATSRSANRASYSNFGSTVEIAAPGGDTGDGVLSTLNTGTTTAGADTYASYAGTSMAAPHVAGVASLVLSVNGALSPAQVLQKLQRSARPFPSGSTCTTSTCGAGIVNAHAAVRCATAATVPSADAGADQSVYTGTSVTLSGYSPDDCAASFLWTQTSGPAVTLSSTTVARPTFTAPSDAAVLVFSLVITDDEGNPSAADTVSITVNRIPTRGSAAGGGGGGGSNCFIATAAYGAPMDEEVRYLRAFRDQYLLGHRAGRSFVEWYYRVSPPIADFIRERPWLRATVRAVLTPFVAVSRWLVSDESLVAQTAE
jgi:serine protease